jgi:hypothetical protein
MQVNGKNRPVVFRQLELAGCLSPTTGIGCLDVSLETKGLSIERHVSVHVTGPIDGLFVGYLEAMFPDSLALMLTESEG